MKKFSTFITENATDAVLDVASRAFGLGAVHDRPEQKRTHPDHHEEEEEEENDVHANSTKPIHKSIEPKTHIEPHAENVIKKTTSTIKKPEPAAPAPRKLSDFEKAHKAVSSTIYRGNRGN